MKGNDMRKYLVGCILLFSFLFPFPSYGIDNSSTPFVYKPFKKFGRGVANMVSCPLEIPYHIYLQGKDEENWWGSFGGYFSGTFIGTGWTVWRFCAGTYDVTTFLFPSYEFSLIQPEYIIMPGDEGDSPD